MPFTIYTMYFSLTGNTKEFVHHLRSYARQQHALNCFMPVIRTTFIKTYSRPKVRKHPFFILVPSYSSAALDRNLIVRPLIDYLKYRKNYQNCIGVIGFGNKEYKDDYCITARQLSKQFHIKFIGSVEMSGNSLDVSRIYQLLIQRSLEVVKQSMKQSDDKRLIINQLVDSQIDRHCSAKLSLGELRLS